MQMEGEFTAEERRILQPFVTNLDSNIFALRNMPEVVMGALFSRYSRTIKSLRRVLLDEFILNKEMGFSEIVAYSGEGEKNQLIATQKAEEFYDRVLVGYGDDSVAELGGAHIAIEQVSNIASKVLEDARIGISPLEKSTRYVYFNQKMDGKYQYYRGGDLLSLKAGDEYLHACDLLFDTYSNLLEKMTKFEMERFPRQADVSDRAYQSTIRAKVCDVLRGLLPASALTNVGLFGNGRAFEYLILKMYASELGEMPRIASSMQGELSKVIPSFVKRANDSHGKATQKYLYETRSGMGKAAAELLGREVIASSGEVTLADYDEMAEEKVVAAMLYPHLDLPLLQVRQKIKSLDAAKRREVVFEYLGRRQNRRHKPGRALENAHYTFDLLANFGQYRDLQRHRMLTQERQLLNCLHGYDLPKELEEAGFDGQFKEAMENALGAWESIAKESRAHAQYVVPLAYRMRWYITMNLREVAHLTELRSMQQGHPDYRRVAQKIYSEIKRVHPQFAEYVKFVDMNEYGLERLESEKKIDKKMEEINKKYAKPPA
ncbi:MAG TPA: FAD-dependent thymidylate synthase [Candidatus Norongarragalinales archaeon]|nr:FAD-dependent thymidylate synthase [Candidatus Norongarragalinales archaeon]